MSGGAPPGARSNGVPVSSWWAPLGRLDPRATGEVLAHLAGAGIAAYAQPDGGGSGSYLEVRPPRRPLDLLYVEGNRIAEARDLVGDRLDDQDPGALAKRATDEDAAFAAIVAGFHELPPASTWPASEDALEEPTATYRRTIRPPDTSTTPPGLLDPGGLLGDEIRLPGEDPFADDNEHFVPPVLDKAPPMPLLTRLACLAIVAGLALIVAPRFWGFDDATMAATLGAALIVGGAIRLLNGLRDDDSSGDDHHEGGAVV